VNAERRVNGKGEETTHNNLLGTQIGATGPVVFRVSALQPPNGQIKNPSLMPFRGYRRRAFEPQDMSEMGSEPANDPRSVSLKSLLVEMPSQLGAMPTRRRSTPLPPGTLDRPAHTAKYTDQDHLTGHS
jgi:hypothetical protein